ncbi:MAG: nitrate reductase [Verrucomicrobiota bacterium]
MKPLADYRSLLSLREWDGPLTEDLVRVPGSFGLGQVPVKDRPRAVRNSICGYCSTGCNLKIHLQEEGAVNLSPDTAYPVNLGMACPKGWEALAPLVGPDRATTPLLRENRQAERSPVSWEQAAEVFCRRMKKVLADHGPESVAFLSTGQICTEEMAFLGAFAKFGMGIRHGDGNTRQCMATSVVAYKQSFGFDAPPYTYADFEESDVLVFIGANPCIAHPIMWQRVLRNQRQPEIIVIDPRFTETAQAATWHVPVAPKGDLALFYSLAHVLQREGWTDPSFLQNHTSGFDDFAAFLQDYAPTAVTKQTGLPAETIEKLARALRPGRRASFWWTMGVNQSHQATRTAQSIINLALMGGHIGKPGTGANSITGQCNAMGSRLFSNTTNLLGGHDFANPEQRQKIAGILGMDEDRIPDAPSLAYDQILERIGEGKIKALWVIATNPAHSWIARKRLKGWLGKLDFLVVQDMMANTHTAREADLVLPAAAWGEKEGTFINSERRIGVVRQVSRPPGQALTDFNIFRFLAEAWGCGEMFKDWTDPEAVFQILQQCSAGQPCDLTGIEGYPHLEARGGIQWPLPAAEDPEDVPERERRLFADHRFYTPDGRARFVFDAPQPLPEPANGEYPLTLLTGRGSSAQWHTETRTATSAVLQRLYPHELLLDLHPGDAGPLKIASGDSVRVASRRGELTAVARVSPVVQPGQVFLPMHDERVNLLTHGAVDPHSRQPAFKACAVQVQPFCSVKN